MNRYSHSARILSGLLLLMLLSLNASTLISPISAQSGSTTVTFVEDTDFSQLGLLNGYYNWSTYGPGVASADYDNDGDLDVYISSSFSHITIDLAELDQTADPGFFMLSDTGYDTLLRNDGDVDGDGNIDFVDVTHASNLFKANSTSLSGAWGDYDGDGFLDLYISEFGHTVGVYENGSDNRLYHNNGDGTFEDVSSLAGVANPCHSSSAQWVDFDNDGDIDLYSLNYGYYRFNRDSAEHETNILYRNDGDQDGDGHTDFTDVTLRAGIGGSDISPPGDGTCTSSGLLRVDLPAGTPSAPMSLGIHNNGSGASWAATWFDHDGDGWQDVFIASDFGVSPLYRNNRDGTFSAISEEAGLMFPGTGMGVDFGDIDLDGDFDLCQTNIGPNYIWRRESESGYRESSAALVSSGTSSAFNVNWACQFFDYDLDGDLDMFVSVGQVVPVTMVTANDNLLLMNNGDGTFKDITEQTGLLSTSDGAVNEKTQGASLVDIDGDGDIDIIVGNSASPPRLYYNQATTQTDNHWIKFDLQAKEGETALGTLIVINVGTSTYYNQQKSCAGSFGCDVDAVHFGLGTADVIDTVTIYWPSGAITSMHDVDSDQELNIIEGVNYQASNAPLVVLSLLAFGGVFVFIRHRMKS